MLTDRFLKIILGDDLFSEAQRLAGQHRTALDVVRTATRQLVAATKAAPPDSNEAPAAAPGLSQHSREGPDAPGGERRDFPPPSNRSRAPRSSARPAAEAENFSFKGCTFIWAGASLQILDNCGREVTIPFSAAVAFVLYLRRPLTIAILELLLSPEDFADIQKRAPK